VSYSGFIALFYYIIQLVKIGAVLCRSTHEQTTYLWCFSLHRV